MPTVSLTIGRGLAAVIAGLIVGQTLQVMLALALDAVYGGDVTAGRWTFNSANVILVSLVGLITGFTVGRIARTRRKLLAVITNFLPPLIFAASFLAINTDPSDYIAKNLDTAPSLWAWIGLIPALVGRHFGTPLKPSIRSNVITSSAGMLMLSIYVVSSALHLYTTFIAYRVSGLFGAVVSFSTPGGAELYWFIRIWFETGTALSLYGQCCIVWLAVGVAVAGVAVLTERRSN